MSKTEAQNQYYHAMMDWTKKRIETEDQVAWYEYNHYIALMDSAALRMTLDEADEVTKDIAQTRWFQEFQAWADERGIKVNREKVGLFKPQAKAKPKRKGDLETVTDREEAQRQVIAAVPKLVDAGDRFSAFQQLMREVKR